MRLRRESGTLIVNGFGCWKDMAIVMAGGDGEVGRQLQWYLWGSLPRFTVQLSIFSEQDYAWTFTTKLSSVHLLHHITGLLDL